MELSRKVAEDLFQLRLSASSKTKELFDELSTLFNVLLSHYQLRLDRTLKEDEIRGLAYIHYLMSFRDRPDEDLKKKPGFKSMIERYLVERSIRITVDKELLDKLQLDKDLKISISETGKGKEFEVCIAKVK